jgi:hypothetical protein
MSRRLRRVPASLGRGLCIAVGIWAVWSVLCGPAEAEWSAIARQHVSYTTDAFQFSSARRLYLSEDPSLPTVVPLGEPEDVIWEPAVEVIRTGPTRLGPNELSVKAHGFIYTDKPIFNHGDFHIQDRQWLNPHTSILLRYRYVPNLFLGPNFERRTGSRSAQEERVTSQTWRAEFERRVNDAFAERDTNLFSVGSRLVYRPGSRVTFTLGYLYERGLADGRQEPQFMDDVSYYLHFVSFETELRLASRLALTLTYVHVRKTFTSGIPGDTHLGREDLTNQGRAEFRYQITADAAATLSYQRTQRSSSNALREFQDSIVTIGGEYRF